MKEITLFSHDGCDVVLKLNNEKRAYAVEHILDVRCRVYSDVDYSMSLCSDKEIIDVKVYLNGEAVDSIYKDGVVNFYNENRTIFAGVIGFVQLSLYVEYNDGNAEWKYTEYASVLIKPTDTNKALDAMIKYVYENQEDILFRDAQVACIGKQLNKSYGDFWSQIILLEEIANVYETDYGYFMANCRTKLEKVDVLDSIEKLQEIDSRTLQYISQHPEYLRNAVTGIKYGGQFFSPTKTLMSQKRITNDIYENQVVISFLEHILDEIFVLKEKIKDYINFVNIDSENTDGYIVSSYLLYMNARDTLEEFFDKIIQLEKQYQKLVNSYGRILKVKRISMNMRPDPTPIFMNLPQYNRIYTCILRWFDKVGYDLLNERVMLSFFNAPSIYEAYVLIKLINQIKEFGYTLNNSSRVNYPKQSNWLHKCQNYNNTYFFSNEHSRLVLYYEPTVYDDDSSSINGIGLYRNNTISLNHETEDERNGHYYVPDFILKYESDDKVKYLICDAKFSRKSKVQYYLMPDLIYKYISSLSTINDNEGIVGMCIFYGLSEENVEMQSFYDKQIKNAKVIKPIIEMLPLSETISYSEQTDNAVELLRQLTE